MKNIYTSVLFATDLGPQSLYIGHRVSQLCQNWQAKLMILHVIEPPLTYTAQFAEQEQKLEQAKVLAQNSLAAFCQQIAAQSYEAFLKVGSPQDEILALAAERQAELVVMGSHGVGGYSHNLGSTAHYVMNQAYCDTLIVQVAHLKEKIEKLVPSQGKYLWQVPTSLQKAFISAKQEPPFGGSKQGFSSVVKRGPRLSLRPARSPYRGGTRENKDEE